MFSDLASGCSYWEEPIHTAYADLTNKMFTQNFNSYACGWALSELLGKRYLSHFGDISGFSNDIHRFVHDKLTVIFLSNMNVTPVTHLCSEIAKTIFGDHITLPLPAEPIEFTKIDLIMGKYHIENETNKVLDISIHNNELFVTIPKMYGAIYKFKLVPISHSSQSTTFLTEMIHEQLVFHYSPLGKMNCVEYMDNHGIGHKLNKVD